MNFANRSYEPEFIDLDPNHYSEEEYYDCLHQMGRIGKFLGGNKASFKSLSYCIGAKKIREEYSD